MISQVDVGKSGCLDFGDLSGGSAKSLHLKLLNRTHATVPIRLVISAVSEHNSFLTVLHDKCHDLKCSQICCEHCYKDNIV